jgi:hypothetical protein
MKRENIFLPFWRWLRSTELFARPFKQIPGKWYLYEYYFERGNTLINKNAEQIKRENRFLEMEFGEEGVFHYTGNIPFKSLSGMNFCRWSRSGNFLALFHPGDGRTRVQIQFAVRGKNLRLLKKRHSGEIEFFGFFRKGED